MMVSDEKQNGSFEERNSTAISLFLAEYGTLREEILKRKDTQQQIVSLALIAPGTIFAFGLQTKSASLILLYPIFAMFLSLAWASQARANRLLGAYIKNQIEAKIEKVNVGWEHFLDTYRSRLRERSLNLLASIGVFIGTQLLAILIGTSVGPFDTLAKMLLILDILSIVVTGIILRPTRPPHIDLTLTPTDRSERLVP